MAEMCSSSHEEQVSNGVRGLVSYRWLSQGQGQGQGHLSTAIVEKIVYAVRVFVPALREGGSEFWMSSNAVLLIWNIYINVAV
jgi:hypothetical protein